MFYPGTITINEFMDRLEAEERESEESTAADTIAEGTRNSTMFRFVVRTLKRYGNSEDARGLFREESEKCVPALDRKELNGIWKSALKYYCLIKQQPGYVPPEQYNAPKEVQWEAPIPFEEITLPPFPVDALPSRVRPYVEAVAETTQTPVDMAGTAAIAVMASCIQGKYLVQAKADWREPTNLYALIVAEPSERKSAVTSLMVRPVNLYETEYNKRNAAALEKNRMQKRILPEALFTTLCAASNTPMTVFHVLDTMSTAAAVLNTHLKNTHVSMSWRLLRSAISCISSSVMTKARITPAMGRIRLSERERIML